MGPSILIVDDHAGFRRHARRLLECEGYEVVGEARLHVGLDAAREIEPELVLVDVYLPDATGSSWPTASAACPFAAGGDDLEP